MSRSLAIGFLGLSLIVFGMVRADANAPARGGVGMIDLEKTLLKTAVGKKAQKSFERELKKLQRALDRKKAAFRKKMAEFEKQKTILRRSAVVKKRRALEAEYVKLGELKVRLDRDLTKRRYKLIRHILKKAAPHIRQVAKQRGFTLIVDRSAILYADPRNDITKAVNRKMK